MSNQYTRKQEEDKLEQRTAREAVADFASLLGFKEDIKIISAHDFVFNYCYTIDPHDFDNAIKKIPDKIYIKRLIDVWLVEKHMIVVKSRQMMATWVFVALNLWQAMFHKGQYVFFISRKESDAGLDSPLSLLSRAMFIYNHLPDNMKTLCIKSSAPPILKFVEMDSVIHGVSQDSDALRTYTASSIFNDEMAFQEKSRESYAALKPTIDGGGRLTCVSTPNGKNNLFYELANDISR
jgi:phage FluMu gp28-like protein